MNIKILCHDDAIAEVKKHPYTYNTIFITNPGDPFYRTDLHDLLKLSKSSITCKFEDIQHDNNVSWQRPPRKLDIEQIFEFAKDKDNFVVCCHAGVSRSSATAFILLCSKMPPSEAIKFLKPRIHGPNELIVKYGAEILNFPEMIDTIEKFNLI